jgi:hypothetical protein
MRTNEEIRTALGAPDVASIACIETHAAGASAKVEAARTAMNASRVRWANYSFADLLISEDEWSALVAEGAQVSATLDGEPYAKASVALLLTELTGGPHRTDQDVAWS